MTKFGDKMRNWMPVHDDSLNQAIHDLANLAAVQHDALDRTNCLRFAANPDGAVCRYDGPGGLPRKEWCRVCIAKHATEEFMERLSND